MTKKSIFPYTVIEQSSEQLYRKYDKNSNILYVILLTFIIIVFIALFFIKIDISVSTTGIIKPKGERVIITSPNTGEISYADLYENQTIVEGDTLFVLESENVTSQEFSLKARQEELLNMLSDLRVLSSDFDSDTFSPQSPIYKTSLLFYLAQLSELITKKKSIETNYLCDKQLVENGIIPPYEFENIKSQYQTAVLAINIFKEKQQAQWQVERNNYEVELREVMTKLLQIDILSDEMVVCAYYAVKAYYNEQSGKVVATMQAPQKISIYGADSVIVTKDGTKIIQPDSVIMVSPGI